MLPRIAALLAAAVWPMYQYFPSHNAVFPGMRSVSWERTLDAKVNGGLALANGVLYAESFDGKIHALDARSGRELWSARSGGVLMTTPIVADGIVVAGTGTSRALPGSGASVWGRPGGDAIVAFDAATGRVRWRYPTVGEDMPSPALVRVRGADAIVFANGDGHVRALALAGGRLLWERKSGGISSMSSAAVDRGAVFLVAGRGALALRPSDGRMLWSAPYGNADCSPTIGKRMLFVQGSAVQPGKGGFNIVYALNEGTGTLRWSWYSGFGTFTKTGSSEEGVAGLYYGGTLYQAIPATDQLIAFDVENGRIRWTLQTSAAVKVSPVERAGRLYFGDTGGTFYTVDARSGRIIAKRRFPSYFTVSPPIVDGRTMYVADDTRIYALPLGTK